MLSPRKYAFWLAFMAVLVPVTSCGQAPSPEQIAQQMVDAARSKSGSPFENLMNTPEKEMAAAIVDWSKLLSVSAGPAAFALIRVDPLFKDSAFQQELFDQAIPPATALIRKGS